MFAVFKTGGKQYRANPNDTLVIDNLPGEVGDMVVFSEVLMVGATLGAPLVAGASVAGEIVEQKRGDKVIAFKKRRRQNSKRRRGHRQHLTVVRIAEILLDGAKPSGQKDMAEKPKRAAPAQGDAAPETKAAKRIGAKKAPAQPKK